MLIAEKKKKYTYQDYCLLEEGAPFQLIDNDLVMSPSPTSLHQHLSMNLLKAMLIFLAQTNDEGELFSAPLDVKLDEGNVFQPDILYIQASRKGDLVKERIEGAPDLVIEILSPSNAYYDLRKKKNTYEKYGVAEYMIVDPIELDIELFSLENGIFVLKQKADVTGKINSIVLPGLILNVSAIFANVQ